MPNTPQRCKHFQIVFMILRSRRQSPGFAFLKPSRAQPIPSPQCPLLRRFMLPLLELDREDGKHARLPASVANIRVSPTRPRRVITSENVVDLTGQSYGIVDEVRLYKMVDKTKTKEG
jgi:hypothetical protein